MERALPERPRRGDNVPTCRARLNAELWRLLPGQDEYFISQVYSWLRRKTHLRIRGDHFRRKVPPMYLKNVELDKSFTEIILRRVGSGLVQQLLELLPLATEAFMEASVDRLLEVDHGCPRCQHHCSSWDRRGERGEHGTWPATDCAVYGFIPPVCLHFALANSCSECGRDVAYNPKGDTGRECALTCAPCRKEMTSG